MNVNSYINYLCWLEDRGIHTAVLSTIKTENRTSISNVELPNTDSRPQEIHKTLFILPYMPNGQQLHLLTKIIKALKIEDNHFQVLLWESNDPGEFWDNCEAAGYRSIFIFDSKIAELITDNEFNSIAYSWTSCVSGTSVLASNDFNLLSCSLEDKKMLWRAIQGYLQNNSDS